MRPITNDEGFVSLGVSPSVRRRIKNLSIKTERPIRLVVDDAVSLLEQLLNNQAAGKPENVK